MGLWCEIHQPHAPFEKPCARLGLSELVYSHVKAHHQRLSVHSRVGSGLCHKKATLLLFFKCVICCCLRESVFWKAEQAREWVCFTLSLSKEQKMKTWESVMTREREDKQWCTTDIGSPCEPWDVWGNGGIMHKMFVTYCRGQFKTLG